MEHRAYLLAKSALDADICISLRVEEPFMVLLEADAMLGTYLHTGLTAATLGFICDSDHTID